MPFLFLLDEKNLRFYLSLFVLLLLVVTAIIFGSQNTQIIELNYLIARANITVAAAVSLFTVFGFFTGIIAMTTFHFYRSLTRKRKIKRTLPEQQ